MTPPTLQQAEEYARLRNLAVDCNAFLMYYEDSEPPWTKKDGKPVSNWKLTMQTWHRVQLEHGGMPKCGYSYCKQPGVYIMGKDRDGQPNRYCIDHRPGYKRLPAEHIVNTIKFKDVPDGKVNVNNERNRQTKDLLG